MEPAVIEAPPESVIATGLQNLEGPVAMPDGSVLVCSSERGTPSDHGALSLVRPDGTVEAVAELDGCPNGAAIGPDGAVYVANIGSFNAETYTGGWIDRVDLSTGEHEVLFSHCDEYRLRGPNDLVFDSHGGFWFTDFGKRREYDIDLGGLFYAKADGSHIARAPGFVFSANGVGVAPDESRVYVAETRTGRLVAFELDAPGRARAEGHIVVATKERLDSLALEADGRVAVAALPSGVWSIAPDGSSIERLPLDDKVTTNICFGGTDLRTAYITCAEKGNVVTTRWPRPGFRLPYQELPAG